MKNLIFCAFAFKDGFQTSMQTKKQAGAGVTEMYLKNIFVALTSAKLYNPNDDVCLVTNTELPKVWKERFEEKEIIIKKVPFDTFEIPKEFPWALAFYKLCALKAMTNEGYERLLLMDADTYTTGSYDELWKEADYGVMLFPVGHSFNHSDREIVRRDFVKYFPAEASVSNIIHYGGEFVAGTAGALSKYLEYCGMVYDKVKASRYNMEAHAGDETIWSVGAALAKNDKTIDITEAGAYIYRFWTGEFYLVSTVTVSNPVCIWHIPNEKETGFVRLYDYYCSNKAFPDVEKAMKIFGMRKASRPFNYYTFMNKVNGKLKKYGK